MDKDAQNLACLGVEQGRDCLRGDDVTSLLMGYALALDFKAVPDDVATIAKQCVLDWAGVTLAGWPNPLVGALVDEANEQGGYAQATLLGCGRKSTLYQAALINGAASHVLDFDDVHPGSRVHPSAPLLSALLALAEYKKMSGRLVIAAFVAGVEVQSRLGLYMGDDHYAAGWHNTATLGTFGATAAIARLIGLDMATACRAAGIAGILASGLRVSFGTMAKPLQVGRAAENGLLAVKLAARSVDSCSNIIECSRGFGEVYGQRRSIEKAFADPTGFQTRGIVFKHHASCFGTHAPIEAALRLGDQIGTLEQIEAVEVIVEPQYLTVCNIAEPHHDTEARFSIAHTVALALGSQSTSSAESFSRAGINRRETAALRQKITVRGAAEVARATASVQVRLKHGAVLKARADAKEKPCGAEAWKRLTTKFQSITRDHLDSSTQEEFMTACQNLQCIEDVSGLMTVIRRGRPT